MREGVQLGFETPNRLANTALPLVTGVAECPQIETLFAFMTKRKRPSLFVCSFTVKFNKGFQDQDQNWDISHCFEMNVCVPSSIFPIMAFVLFFDEFIGSAYREETFAFLLVMSLLAWLIEKRICIGVRFVHKVMAQT
jgi:hypothetical protein